MLFFEQQYSPLPKCCHLIEGGGVHQLSEQLLPRLPRGAQQERRLPHTARHLAVLADTPATFTYLYRYYEYFNSSKIEIKIKTGMAGICVPRKVKIIIPTIIPT
jgi:hypothetical protein